MAIGRISGSMLLSNLDRQGANLSVDTDLVFYDVENRRLGVNTVTPDHPLTVNGNASIQGNIQVTGNMSVADTSFLNGVFGGAAEFSSINNTVIGNVNPSTGVFTNLTATGQLSSGNVAITGGTLDGVAITSSDGDFIELSTSVLLTSNAQITGGKVLNLQDITAINGNIRELDNGNLWVDYVATISNLQALSGNVVNLLSSNVFLTGGNVEVDYVSAVQSEITTLDVDNLAANAFALDTGTAANLTVSNLVIIGNAVGTIETSIVSEKMSVEQVIDSSEYYIPLVTLLNGNTSIYTNSGISYVPISATLSVNNIEGDASIGDLVVTNSAVIDSGVTSISTLTGGLQLTNGTGLALDTGNIHVGGTVFSPTSNINQVNAGNITVTGTVTTDSLNTNAFGVTDLDVFETITVNELQTANVNSVFSGANDSSLLALRSDDLLGYDSVVIGGSNFPSSLVDGAKLVIDSVDSILLPSGTTAQRPSELGYTDVAGMFRYNSELGSIEWFDGAVWKTSGTGSGGGSGGSFQVVTVERDEFVGDGTETNFLITKSSTTDSLVLFVGGFLQTPTTAYTVTGTSLDFTAPPALGEDISAIQLTSYSSREQITADGINDTFLISQSSEAEKLLVSINGVLQNTTAYTVTGNELEFTGIPSNGYIIDIVFLSAVLGRSVETANGTDVTFLLPLTALSEDCIVSINGVIQTPVDAYTVTDNQLTFSDPPPAGSQVEFIVLRQEIKLSKISSENGFNVVETTDTGVYISTGIASSVPVEHWTTEGARVHTLPEMAIVTANVATTVDSFALADYRSAKYLIQARDSTNYQVAEVLVIHDGVTAYSTVYGVVQTGNVGIVTSTIVGSSVEVQFTSLESGANVRITKDYIAS